MRKIVVAIFSTLLLFIPVTSSAQASSTLFVELSGSDTGDCTSSPCRTLEYAVSQASDGDTIMIGRGVFEERDFDIQKSVSIVGQGATDTEITFLPDIGISGFISMYNSSLTPNYPAVTINDLALSDIRIATGGAYIEANQVLIKDTEVQIRTDATLVLNNSEITGESMLSNGLWDRWHEGSLIIKNTVGHDLKGADYPIWNWYGFMSIEDSVFFDNQYGVIRNGDQAEMRGTSIYSNGGGVDNSGIFTISDSSITNNVAVVGMSGYPLDIVGNHARHPAIYFQNIYNPTLHIVNSYFGYNTSLGNGGAINNQGNLVPLTLYPAIPILNIKDSTFERNDSPESGGAIANYSGEVQVDDSSFISNQADDNGGAIYSLGDMPSSEGNLNTIVTLNQVTLSSNEVRRGLGTAVHTEGEFSATYLQSSTVAFNNFHGIPLYYQGYALSVDKDAALYSRNSIISNNGYFLGSQVNLMTQCSSGVYSEGYNLASDASCDPTGAGDLSNTDPQLKPLANNGGVTQTHEIIGGPAIDAGDPLGCKKRIREVLQTSPIVFDQRGSPYLRHPAIGFGRCDIGAFEMQGQVKD